MPSPATSVLIVLFFFWREDATAPGIPESSLLGGDSKSENHHSEKLSSRPGSASTTKSQLSKILVWVYFGIVWCFFFTVFCFVVGWFMSSGAITASVLGKSFLSCPQSACDVVIPYINSLKPYSWFLNHWIGRCSVFPDWLAELFCFVPSNCVAWILRYNYCDSLNMVVSCLELGKGRIPTYK